MCKAMIRVFIFFTIVIMASPLCAQKKLPKGIFGIKYGRYGGGTVAISDKGEYTNAGQYEGYRSYLNSAGKLELDTDDGYTFGVFVDYPTTKHTFAGIAFDIAHLDFGKDAKYLMNGAVFFKGNLHKEGGSFSFRPGLGLGVAMLPPVFVLNSATFFTIQATGEAVIMANERFGMFIDLGSMWAPAGGDGDFSITGGPFMLMRAGLIFR